MKQIVISGSHNINCINGNKKKELRSIVTYEEPELKQQIFLINKSYMNIEHQHSKNIASEINRKINGYKSQDVKKNIFNEELLVNAENVLEKLVSCKLNCYYCKNKVKVLYKIVRDQQQWTLDRINNDLCHSNDNTVISCLKCNLQRRVKNSDDFVFTKQLKINKIDC